MLEIVKSATAQRKYGEMEAQANVAGATGLLQGVIPPTCQPWS